MSKEYPRIDVTVDAVVFGYNPGQPLSLLLIKRLKEPFKDCWAIPGGFVEVDEALDKAASRELKEETGLEINNFEQLYAFGAPGRDPRKRIVSIAYYTLVRMAEHNPVAGDDAHEVQWFSVEELPALAFDHSNILQMANGRLKEAIQKKKAVCLEEFNESEILEIMSRLRST